MNNVVRVALKGNNLRTLLNPVKNVVSMGAARKFARNLWYMCNNSKTNDFQQLGIATNLTTPSNLCSCGCGSRKAHTKAEQDLVEFLTEEIVAERKAQKSKTIPSELDGFKAKLNGAEVTFSKGTDKETIKIHFNVNHTVDSDAEPDVNPQMDNPEMGELKSKPTFKVDLIRGKTTVSLVCSFIKPDQQEEGYNDVFGIDEISIYDGEWNENVYSVSGEIVDSYLYDLLLNYLDEKGITNEFIEKVSQYSTAYEHSAYISLLEGLSKFASGK